MRNIFRHLQSGAAPPIGFAQIAPPAASACPAPLFLLGPAGAALHAELFHQLHLGEVGCYSIDDAILAPTGIAMKDGVAFTSLAFNHVPGHAAPIVARAAGLDAPMHHVRGKLAVIYGPGHETYGHWLVDFLPRLWVLAMAGHDIHTLRYVVPPELTGWAARLLGRIGIRTSQLVPYRYWREVMRTDRLLLPTGLRTENRMSPHFAQATAFWTSRMLRAEPRRARPKLFLSRARAPAARMLANRAEIETIASRRGFAIVSPETLSLAQQATLFTGARIIAGEYGSALHGSVYAPPGTITIGLRGTARHPSFVQSGVAAALGQHAAYVFGRTQGEIEQSFRIQKEDFERALDIAEAAAKDCLP